MRQTSAETAAKVSAEAAEATATPQPMAGPELMARVVDGEAVLNIRRVLERRSPQFSLILEEALAYLEHNGPAGFLAEFLAATDGQQ